MRMYDLLIIDPQNDFLDVAGAALPVPGAQADMDRLAHWLSAHPAQVRSLTVTLDSHASVGVERTTFLVAGRWQPGGAVYGDHGGAAGAGHVPAPPCRAA